MSPSSMQKHIGKKWPQNVGAQLIYASNPGKTDMIGNQTVFENHLFRLLAVEYKNTEKKNSHIDKDQHDIDNWEAP